MSHYLFIQSQDPFVDTRATRQYELAMDLKKRGHDVTVVLVQNGVVPARRQAVCQSFDALANSGLTLVADAFSLEQRDITPQQLKDNITTGSMDNVIDAMLAGHKVIWN